MNKVTGSRDYKYMYEFCTTYCKQNDCPEDVSCLNAHSKHMIRRIPKQDPSLGGLFNYIPKHCPQYQKSKKCSSGVNCFLAHGHLEIIFHPLLYKTKLCLSKLENGVCRKYGIYCAKAHKHRELRNLVQIYGENWKEHYDTSKRKAYSKKTDGSVLGFGEPLQQLDMNVTGVANRPIYRDKDFMEVVNSEINDYLSYTNSMAPSARTKTSCEAHMPLGFQSSTIGCHPERNAVDDYTQLYSEKIVDESISNKVDSTEMRPSLCELFCLNSCSISSSRGESSSGDACSSFSYFSNEMEFTKDGVVDLVSYSRALRSNHDADEERVMTE